MSKFGRGRLGGSGLVDSLLATRARRAALLAVVPGLGHVYLGEPLRGILFFLAIAGAGILDILELDLAFIGLALGVPTGLGTGALWLYSIRDAYLRAGGSDSEVYVEEPAWARPIRPNLISEPVRPRDVLTLPLAPRRLRWIATVLDLLTVIALAVGGVVASLTVAAHPGPVPAPLPLALGLVAAAAYLPLSWALVGRPLFHGLLGLRVIRQGAAERRGIGLEAAILRTLVFGFSWPFLIAWIPATWTPLRQTLPDLVAHTVVVRTR